MSTIGNNIVGQYEANLNAQANTDRVAADKNTFLKLLVAQLTHQDPLNPTEDKEFIAQLAQFTSVEELQNLNKGMDTLNSSFVMQQTTNAINLIGKSVTAKGDIINIKKSDDPEIDLFSSPIYFTFPTDAANSIINVYSTTADDQPGRLVATINYGAKKEGVHVYQWDGRDPSGNLMPDGNYILNVVAVDGDGNNMLVDSQSTGVVVVVETQSDGNHKLVLEDNRIVYFNDVQYISDMAAIGGGNGDGDSDGDGDGGSGEDGNGDGSTGGDEDGDGDGSTGEDGDKTPETGGDESTQE